MAYLPNVPPNASPDYQNAVLNDIINIINQQSRTQILTDGQSSRYLFGFQQGGWPGGDFGIKISAPGKDVSSAAYSDLLFYWDFTTGTMYWNDASGINYRQDGLLPDGTSNLVVAKPGLNVADLF